MGLAAYKKKRSFDVTPEPEGKVGPRTGHALTFVVQKHDARRLHYDFRLEMEGVLRSWAVPKGPSVDPADKRYAAHVEDHPIEYGTFEGVIPEGEYGGGPVVIWDRGTWTPKGDPVEAYKKGRIEFTLHGERMKGGWILVKMGKGEEKSWLLMKRKDEEARPGHGEALVEERPESVVSGRNLDQVLVDKDRVWRSNREEKKKKKKPARATARSRATARPAVRTTKIEGARRAPLPQKVELQLATLYPEPPKGGEWLHEIKLDGYRMLVRVEAGKAKLITRGGLDWTSHYPPIAEAAAALPVQDALLDGEVVVLLPDGRSDFGALQKLGPDSELAYFAFDLLHHDGWDLRKATLLDRKEALKALLKDVPAPIRFNDHVLGRGPDLFRVACEKQLEGIISKRADRPYASGRGKDWLKIKCKSGQEVIIAGYSAPKRTRVGLGALLVAVRRDDGQLHYAGKVGTGFTDALLVELEEKLSKLEVEKPPIVDPPRGAEARGVTWVKPVLVAEVECTEWTKDGKLRHPSFKGLRGDKPASQVVEERPAPKVPDKIAGIKISNPGRVVYPEVGITKGEVALYVEAVGEHFLREIRDRPLSLVRCPQGQGKPCFFQKNALTGLPDTVHRVPIEEGKKVLEYVAVDTLDGLVGLVQMGVLEIHPWGARRDDVEHPDRMIFDLDPDVSIPWRRVIEAARECKDLLEELGLESFLKTTGGKGLHVVVPLARRKGQDWDVVREASHRIVLEMIRRRPGAYTDNMRKDRRKGKMFLDYLRNGRGATAVAAYSMRARPRATVALPVRWDELTESLRPDQFDIVNVPDRMRRLRKDPWEGIDAVRQSLTKAIQKKLGM